ncbi:MULTISPECIES: hypothetical protein [unclassified Streptomyces]|uniref:hypothetical protein n=1 Tax=unclassified Streptomyces TaxID=2593676 RepID=UPI0024A96192|nr:MULTISPECIES: hypothetical protein [unclassified Streptomyces]
MVAPPPPSHAPHNAFQPPHQQQYHHQHPAPPHSLLPYAAPTWPVAAGGAPDDGADLSFVAVGPGSSLLIDADGVTVGPEGAETQYTWAEIRTVAYAAEGPKHLGVVVHLHHGTAHPCVIAARRKSRLQEWLQDLPLILECFQ